MNTPSALADWTPEEIALGKKWVEAWRLAREDLERFKRKEIRELDTYKPFPYSAAQVSSNNNYASKSSRT